MCVIKADLQTSSQRLNLSGGSGQPTATELAPDDSIDDVIHHEVKELGTHMYVLTCTLCTVLQRHVAVQRAAKKMSQRQMKNLSFQNEILTTL